MATWKRRGYIACVLAWGLAQAAWAQTAPTLWRIVPEKSTVEFTGTAKNGKQVTGTFFNVQGRLEYDANTVAHSRANFRIDVEKLRFSVNKQEVENKKFKNLKQEELNDKLRNQMLSSKFFNLYTNNNPKKRKKRGENMWFITFVSDTVTPLPNKKQSVRVCGRLTLIGNTNRQCFSGTLQPRATPTATTGGLMEFEGTATVDRTQFKFGKGMIINAAIDKKVAINIHILLKRQDQAPLGTPDKTQTLNAPD